MQRKASLLILFTFLFAFCSFAQQSHFHYKRKIESTPSAGWYSIPLPVDMFGTLRRDFADIRILSVNATDTVQIPYLIQVQEDVVSDRVVDLPVFNKSKRNGKLYLTVELRKDEKVNHLDLEFDEPNFNGYAKVEGSHDQKTWFDVDSLERILSIREGAIDFHSTSLNFPLSNYRYLRVQIEADIPLTLSSATFRKRIVKKGVSNEGKILWEAVSNKQTGETVINIALANFQPVSSIRIETEQKTDFYRPFTIEALRDSVKTEKGWTYYYDHVMSGYVTSLRNEPLEFPFLLAKKIRVTVHNGDNAALKFKNVSVKGPQIQLTSSLDPGTTYLFYGDSNTEAPSYDVVHFRNKIPSDLPVASLAPAEYLITPEAGISPLLESKYWLWGMLGVVVLVLGFFTVRMMGKK